MTKELVVIDTEVYSNYFLLSCKHLPTGKVKHFEMFDNNPANASGIKSMMHKYTTVSFNGLSFDLPIISAVLSGYNCQGVKKIADKIIKSNLPSWSIVREFDLHVPKTWDHIDLIEVAPGQSSLKIYGGRMNAVKLQDLPIDPDATISPSQRKLLREYCVNDLDTTELLYKKLEKQIALRASMSEQYGLDLRSKSDAQIAEAVIKSELSSHTGKQYRPPKLSESWGFHYQDPKIVSFRSPNLKSVFNRILSHRFTLGANGSVQMPDFLKKERIVINGREYQMGIGGLHSCEKSQYVTALEDECLQDWDVASYYPNIILQQQLAPDSLGKDFLKVYQSIVERRIVAKRAKDMVTANTLKICVNGSFGKLGSKWSALYAPDLLIQTTITGQLCLLMLIERMVEIGVDVVSANTDGIVLHFKKSQLEDVRLVAFDWMLDTSYELEKTDYRAIASRDVNNYIAVKLNGDIKRKGCFAEPGLQKNPDAIIVYDAVTNYIATGMGIEDTVTSCRDVTKFVKVRRVQGGAIWRDIELGKAVRFYYSTNVKDAECIHYLKNSNRVPKSNGASPLMDLPEQFPYDVNHSIYIEEAKDLLALVGCNA